ncbi:MlaD family protein [Mycobacterium spongiae]|uniref:MCE family protein n=1 Tax=Mycobacterium spongiae TaxID=886343 RepID=A0A975JXY8_9MYCO|nr:MCE family protein [Mycobacterium spongiae]QUR67749.1 MCE family protein [Mycobacterium spongiae]
MPNSFDVDPRSPSNRWLFAAGLCFIVVAAVTAALMVAKSQGRLNNLVRVDIELVNIGDGLPARSDVKFRGVLVGSVSDVSPSRSGRPNVVHVALKPEYASGIPNTVTARVVPSNVFAVSSVQLVENGPGSGPLRPGAVIAEDKSLPTVLFQDVLAKLRGLLAAVARKPDDTTVGLLTTLGQATQGRGRQLSQAGHDLNEILTQLNTVVSPDDTGPSTLSALTAAADGLRDVSPQLFDTLATAIQPMRTFAEKRWELADFLSGGLATVATLGDAFDHQTDRLIVISTQFTPVLGVLADHAGEFHGISSRMETLANKFYDEAYDPETKLFTLKAVVALTPSRTYVRADCPRYGALEGPSCHTAPEVPTAPDLMPALESMGFPPTPGVNENRPNFAPPRDSVRGVPDQPPPPVAPAPPDQPPPQSESEPAEVQPPPPAFGPAFGGNVGPVGSSHEADHLRRIVRGPVSAATQLLLGPLVRGTTVRFTQDPAGDR